jgi:hypothetical protein
MPEQNLPIVKYESVLAAEIADLLSSRQDLLSTEAICEHLVVVLSAGNDESQLADVLWTAALVRYARCFTTGKRKPLDPALISHLHGDPIGAHNYYKNQRDKLIAHSVNPFEQSLIGIVLSPPEAEARQVKGIADLYVRMIVSDLHGVKELAALAHEFRYQIELMIEQGKQKLLAEVKDIPLATLYQLEPFEIKPPAPDMAAKGRK